MRPMRTIPWAAVLFVAVATTTASCTAVPTTSDTSTPSGATPTRSSTPSESSPAPSTSAGETFIYPDTADPTQVAIFLKYVEATPSSEIIAGPAGLTADRPFTVEAQCEGDDASFEVVTADADRRVLVEGEIECDDPPSGQFTYQLPYSGPVQVNLIDTDDVGRAWVRVVQP